MCLRDEFRLNLSWDRLAPHADGDGGWQSTATKDRWKKRSFLGTRRSRRSFATRCALLLLRDGTASRCEWSLEITLTSPLYHRCGRTWSRWQAIELGKLAPTSIAQSGVEGIATRHGYRIEMLEQSLFDLEADPSEQRNVAKEHPDVVAQLEKMAQRVRLNLAIHWSGSKGKGFGLRASTLLDVKLSDFEF